MKRSSTGLGLVVAMMVSGCTGLRPPPPKPPHSVPVLTLDPAPAVAGQGRIAITAVGVHGEPGPFWVEQVIVQSSNVYLSASSHICAATPCVANMPYGNYALKIGNNKNLYGQVAVIIGEKPTVVNVVVGCWDLGLFGCLQDPGYEQWQPPDGQIFTMKQ